MLHFVIEVSYTLDVFKNIDEHLYEQKKRYI